MSFWFEDSSPSAPAEPKPKEEFSYDDAIAGGFAETFAELPDNAWPPEEDDEEEENPYEDDFADAMYSADRGEITPLKGTDDELVDAMMGYRLSFMPEGSLTWKQIGGKVLDQVIIDAGTTYSPEELRVIVEQNLEEKFGEPVRLENR